MNQNEEVLKRMAEVPKPDHVICPRCRHDFGKLEAKDCAYNRLGYYVKCPECGKTTRLSRKTIVDPGYERIGSTIRRKQPRVRMSKKERIRRRWAGREHLRFARAGKREEES